MSDLAWDLSGLYAHIQSDKCLALRENSFLPLSINEAICLDLYLQADCNERPHRGKLLQTQQPPGKFVRSNIKFSRKATCALKASSSSSEQSLHLLCWLILSVLCCWWLKSSGTDPKTKLIYSALLKSSRGPVLYGDCEVHLFYNCIIYFYVCVCLFCRLSL